MSTLLPFVVPFAAWVLPNLTNITAAKWVDEHPLRICGYAFCLTVLCYILWAPYHPWKEANGRINELKCDASNKGNDPLLKPKLRVELRSFQQRVGHCMGPNRGTWEVVDEGFAVIVTNVGPTVCISRFDVVVRTKEQGDVILQPEQSHVVLPQRLDPHNTMPNNYKVGLGGIANLLMMNPRVIVKTSCVLAAIVQRLHFLSEDAPAIFRADGQQPLPYVVAVAGGEQLQRPVARQDSPT